MKKEELIEMFSLKNIRELMNDIILKDVKALMKKGELPGWSIVVMLIIGLFVLFVIIFIAVKSKTGINTVIGGL